MTYEGLVARPKEELTDLFKFMYQTESLEGTVLEQRIAQQVEKGASRAYTLKKPENKHDMFTAE